MKKLPVVLALLGVSLGGGACEESPLARAQQQRAEQRRAAPTYRVIQIEGCEYLRQETSNGYPVITHKGNCRNPIHPYRDTTRHR
ncbi:hypothetical protein [Hymenobacter persicinus]|uniref:Uncharacterized protein n=1 Tax=Hymenobacter persicinus TaxID=2025506 RepID=A0A4Q5LFC3_9BACT|nr:hypothetical protein [Hymenobacter persicinus]RYU81319.1 hypothetical protein EWM57_07010 [Hymenobacter persicinus]